MTNNRKIPASFLNYKTVALNPKLLKFLSGRHNTKVGTWGEITLGSGSAEFEFLNNDSQAGSTESIMQNTPFTVPPAVWHRLKSTSEDIEGLLKFYCHPLSYFHKKYKLTRPHSDVVKLNTLYLKALFDSNETLDILDLGCGRGRNSLYLSQFDHQIKAVDIDEKQLGVLTNIIDAEKINNIHASSMDLKAPQIEGSFNVVLLNVVLQFLTPDKAWSLLKLAQEQTKIGGLHSIVCPMTTPGVTWPEHFTFGLEADELREYYLDSSWAILEYNEDLGNLHRLDDDGLPIRGRFASMIAQKIV